MKHHIYIRSLAALAIGGATLAAGLFFGMVPAAWADTDDTDVKAGTRFIAWGRTHLNPMGEGREAMLKEKAAILGLSVSDLEKKLQNGETFVQIAADQGIDEEVFHAKVEETRIAHLNALVANGTITQAEMDARLARIKARAAEEKTCEGPRMPRRFLGAHTFKTANGQQ